MGALTLRPGQSWLAHEAVRLRASARAGDMVVLCDDPPRTGAALATAARELEALGFAPGSVVLLLQLFGTEDELPEDLRRYPSVLLPWPAWSVQRQLATGEVRRALNRFLRGRGSTLALRRTSAVTAGDRDHASAHFAATIQYDGLHPQTCTLRVRGVGLGYFGEHALAIGDRLRDWAAPLYWVDRGMLYEAFPEPGERLGQPLSAADLSALAGYVHARARALPLDEDPSRRLAYRGAAWQRVGQTLARSFGPRLGDLGRPLAAAAAHSLLDSRRPSVIDRMMEPERFRRGAGGVIKTDLDTGPFTSVDDHCFDPVYDLARLALSLPDSEAVRGLLSAYEAAGGAVDHERWFLYNLLLLAEEGADNHRRPLEREKALPRAMSEYYGEVLLSDLRPDAEGPPCAVDLDGVLETAPIGYNQSTPAGLLALRALVRHGYRPLVASGRSLHEVVQRCRAYRLDGGIAEYGAAVYDRDRGCQSLLEPEEEGLLDRVRSAVTSLPGVEIDPDHRLSVRAFRTTERRHDGLQRQRLSEEEAACALAGAGASGRIRPVHGIHQTDFTPARVGKEIGLRALTGSAGGSRGPALALAVGDSAPDLGMLLAAERAAAPANADAAVRAAGVWISRHEHQRGFGDAVARLIGHRAGSCGTCAAPPLPARSRLLLDLLQIGGSGRVDKVLGLARLFAEPDIRRRVVL